MTFAKLTHVAGPTLRNERRDRVGREHGFRITALAMALGFGLVLLIKKPSQVADVGGAH